MRMTKREISYNYPSLENHPDVVEMLYGDIPNYTYDLKDYKKLETFREKFQYVHSTWANLETVDAYIFATNGRALLKMIGVPSWTQGKEKQLYASDITKITYGRKTIYSRKQNS